MNAAAAALEPLTPAQRVAAIDELKLLDEQEKRAAGKSLEAFLYRYLPASFYHEPGEFHRGIYGDLQNLVDQIKIDGEVVDAAAYAYPRSHGKTTTITLGYLLWVLSEWRSMPHFQGEPPFILIVSDTRDQARDRSLDLRDELEANGLLLQDYGNKVPGRGKKWTESDWTTSDGCRVKAVGSGNPVRGLLRSGRRPTLIVCDDLENDEQVATKGRRLKLERWLVKALIPCGIEGRVLTIILGTILHADSLLSKLLAEDKYPGWLKRRYAALYDENGHPSADGTIPLWPQGWTLEMLQRRRRKIGTVAFTQEYLNQAIDEATALFQWRWLQAAKRRGAGRPFLYGKPSVIPFHVSISTWDYVELATKAGSAAYQVVVTAWDLAIVDTEEKARERDSDYTVGLTVCLDATDRLHVRRIYRKRGMTPAQVRNRIIAEQNLVGACYVVVENNAAQKAYELDLRERGLPIVGHHTDRKKHSVYEGVPAMALQFELGRIDFANDTEPERNRIDALIAELHGLGMEAHDDLVMALWIAIGVIRKWQRRRDAKRRKLLGPAPPGYVDTFPTREAA